MSVARGASAAGRGARPPITRTAARAGPMAARPNAHRQSSADASVPASQSDRLPPMPNVEV